MEIIELKTLMKLKYITIMLISV